MKSNHTLLCLHVSLEDTDTNAYHLEQHQPTGNMFQGKIDEIFNDMPNVLGIADYILAVGYDDDGRDHDETMQKVLQRCRKVNLKLNI